MPAIFQFKTDEAYTIKILAELLQHCLKSACFMIDADGIKLRTIDSQKTLLLDLTISRENLRNYKCTKPMIIGVNVIHLYKMLKSIKKKDSVMLFVDDQKEDYLGVEVKQVETKRVTTSHVKIQNIQSVNYQLPEGYDYPVVITSVEYQKMVKDLGSISKVTSVYARGPIIRFSCEGGDLYSREVTFGEEDEDGYQDYGMTNEEYEATFNTTQLTQLMKVAGLSTNLQIYAKQDLPLKFKLNIGTIGTMSVFIKSREQMEGEQEGIYYSSDSDPDSEEN